MITFKKSAALREGAPNPTQTVSKCILITGSENKLARSLAFGLQELGHAVTVQVVAPDVHLQLKQSMPVIAHSLADPRFGEALRALAPDVVIHASAEATADQIAHRPLAVFNRLIDKTAALCEAVRVQVPEAHVVLFSTSEVYGECDEPAQETAALAPASRAGNYARIAEELAQDFAVAHALDLTIARLFSTYGPGLQHNPVADIVFHLLAPQHANSVLRYPAQARRDLLHAGDALVAVGKLIETRSTGVFNLATGQSLALGELTAQICAILEKQPPRYAEELSHGAALSERANIDKLKALGFAPQIPLIEGLRGYIAWWSGVKAA